MLILHCSPILVCQPPRTVTLTLRADGHHCCTDYAVPPSTYSPTVLLFPYRSLLFCVTDTLPVALLHLPLLHTVYLPHPTSVPSRRPTLMACARFNTHAVPENGRYALNNTFGLVRALRYAFALGYALFHALPARLILPHAARLPTPVRATPHSTRYYRSASFVLLQLRRAGLVVAVASSDCGQVVRVCRGRRVYICRCL